MAQIHKCGQCTGEFNSEQAYLDHTCDVSGFTPVEPENLGEEFVKISQAAMQRGDERSNLEAQGVDAEEAKEMTKDIGSEIK